MIILRKDNNTRHTNNPKEAQDWMSEGYEVIKGLKQVSSAPKKELKSKKSKPKTEKSKKK